jgi:hypothetical protein
LDCRIDKQDFLINRFFQVFAHATPRTNGLTLIHDRSSLYLQPKAHEHNPTLRALTRINPVVAPQRSMTFKTHLKTTPLRAISAQLQSVMPRQEWSVGWHLRSS